MALIFRNVKTHVKRRYFPYFIKINYFRFDYACRFPFENQTSEKTRIQIKMIPRVAIAHS